jgi:uncharacterized membrane protein
MSNVRLWIVLTAIVSFLAGSAAGVLLARSDDAPASGWAAYAERLADEYDLSPERRGSLRILLDEYATEVANKRRAYESRILNQIEPDLSELAARYDGYIRDFVLPPAQRAQYDQRSRPLDLVAAP